LVQLHRLEGFFWVARTGGYASAARAFPYPLTQPAVYQQVRKLEEELGVRLFERQPGGRVQPTAAGRHLYRFAAPFFEQVPVVMQALRAGTLGEELRIGAEALVLNQLLPEWLRRLHRRLPDARVDVRELASGDPEPVQDGSLDLAVAYFPDPLPPTVQARRVATLRPTLVLPRRHPLARRPRPDLRAFRDDTFVAYHEGTLQHDLQMKALARSGITPRRLIAASSAGAILGLVAAGLGYSLVPALDGRDPRRAGVASRPFTAAAMEFPVLAVWRRASPVSRAVELALATAPRPGP
jgi:DNA-binding transcriptional LysR family regulator